ncbi:hemicentin-1-like, partial [Anoplophora glabripennis]|uniref:hemicentin-1-like n=1 Tax=Anoplophora glabripennis TaxID=217634 RepID=UPI0008736642
EKKYRVLPEGLHIINVTRNGAQVYKCRAHHLASGAIIYKNITLDVHHKPYQTYAEEKVYVFLDEQVNLTCEVEANPPPIFKWYRKMGKTIQVSDYISVLQLNVTKETPGAYMCIAYNTVGDLEKYFNVQLAEHPDMPTNIELVKAENDKLQLKVEVPDIPYRARDPVMDPQWIVLEYKPESESEWSSMEFNITDSIILIGLSKNTKYRIQAATRNAAGLSQYYQTMFETSAAISVHTKLSAVIYSPFILISFFSLFWIA